MNVCVCVCVWYIGTMIATENWSIPRKTCLGASLFVTNPTWTGLASSSGCSVQTTISHL